MNDLHEDHARRSYHKNKSSDYYAIKFRPISIVLQNSSCNHRICITGDGLNYEITYSYVYSNKYPLKKNGDMVYINGDNAGKHFPVGYTFGYY